MNKLLVSKGTVTWLGRQPVQETGLKWQTASEEMHGEGLKAIPLPHPPHPSHHFSLVVFRAAPQLTERLEEAKILLSCVGRQVKSHLHLI